jgi:hypothetical protein
MDMKRALLVAMLLLASSATVAVAAPSQCFRPAEVEAEQAMRYQAELMVLSDSCGAEQTYVSWTTRVRRVLVSYQKALIEHFRRTGSGGRAQSTFDSYQTRLANEVSLRTGQQPLAAVCQRAADFLAKAGQAGEDEFRKYAAAQAVEHKTDYTTCAK